MSKYYKAGDRGRRSIRMRGYNYAGNGVYFVTLVTKDRRRLFGKIENGEMILSEAGVVAQRELLAIPERFPFVKVDEVVIMPDHVHVLFIITKSKSELEHSANNPQSGTLGSVVRSYKTRVTQWARENVAVSTVWHRNYYEVIVRDQKALSNIRRYIRNNPIKAWQM